MTHQAPEGWRLPPRGPQHAAPFGGSAPLSMRAHRALRLFVTAGAWAAGLCLIIGSVALVAEAAGPAPEAHVTTAAGYPQRTRPLPGHGAKAHHAPASSGSLVVLRTFVGTGNWTTSQFTVAAHSRWELRWSYQCAARLPRGRLVISEGNDAGGGVSVDAAGAAGQGSAWTYSDAGSHYLVVLANCAWTIDVAGHR
jgi:hypothetical protein